MQEPSDDDVRLAEAYLFASADPVTARALAELLDDTFGFRAEAALRALAARYRGRGVELAEVGGGWQFRTAADLAPRLERRLGRPRRLPRAAMEILAVIARHQPMTRAEVDDVRGVAGAQASFDILADLGLIAPCGQKAAAGRPTLWQTTPEFLAHFGLRSLRDLPPGRVPPAEPPE